MGIDYRKEVDSGYDRKRILEAGISALLKDGLPAEMIEEIIQRNKNFIFPHEEMLQNLKKGYINKEEQLLEIYGGYSKELSEQIVPDSYSGVSHPVGGELYPMTKEEEIEIFKRRDILILKINNEKQKETKKIEKEKNKILSDLTKFKVKFPIIDKIEEAIIELDNIKEQKEEMSLLEFTIAFKKQGLNTKDIKKYETIYNAYKELENNLTETILKLENTSKGKTYDKEIVALESEKNLIEQEIIQRNTKYINWFIRTECKNLIIETDDLFQICYSSMGEALKKYDYKQNHRFVAYAKKYMQNRIKRDFKDLTGYDWKEFWMKRKIETLLKTVSEKLGRKVTVQDLIMYGFLDVTEKDAYTYLDIKQQYSFSEAFPIEEEKEIDNEYALYYGDDEIEDYEKGLVDQVKINYDKEIFREVLKQEIKRVLSTLTDREKTVLTLRFGLNNEEPKTLEETSKIFGVTRERIRQIEAKALRKLRHPSRSKKLKDFLNDDYSEEIIYTNKIR